MAVSHTSATMDATVPTGEPPTSGQMDLRSVDDKRTDSDVVGRRTSFNARPRALFGVSATHTTDEDDDCDDEHDYSTADSHLGPPARSNEWIEEEGRTGAASLTCPEELAARWIQLSRGLNRYLSRLGVRRDDRPDILQEVALRAQATLRSGQAILSLESWFHSVARNIVIDEARRSRFVDRHAIGDEDDRCAPVDVEAEILARLRLSNFYSVWRTLSEEQRAQLMAPADGIAASRNRQYVAKHRLRVLIQARLEQMSVVVGVSVAKLRQRLAAVPRFGVAAAMTAAVIFTHAEPARVGALPMPRHDSRRVSSLDHGPVAHIRAVQHEAPMSRTSLPIDRRRQAPHVALKPPSVAGQSPYVNVDEERPEGEPLICLNAPPVASTSCVDHPLDRLRRAPR